MWKGTKIIPFHPVTTGCFDQQTYFVNHILSSGAGCLSVVDEIHRTSWKPEIHYPVCNTLLLVPFLPKFNPFHTTHSSRFLSDRLIFTLASILISPKWCFIRGTVTKTLVALLISPLHKWCTLLYTNFTPAAVIVHSHAY